MSAPQSKLVTTLRSLIGTHGLYQEKEYELIEVLEQGPAVVLRRCDSPKEIQTDLHGEPRRVVEQTHTVAALSEVSHRLHPVLREFFDKALADTLDQLING